jgi:hypothetical protein
MKTQKVSYGIRSGSEPRLYRLPRAGSTQPQKHLTLKAALHLPQSAHHFPRAGICGK